MGVAKLTVKDSGGKKIDIYVENRLESGQADGGKSVSGRGRKPANRSSVADQAQEATMSLESQLEIVAQIAKSAMDKLKVISPNKIEIEMGVTFSGKAGVPFITEGSASANMKVNISWGK